MKLICLGSSSKQNCYILKSKNGKCLILEAGVRFLDVKKAIDYKVRDIVGVLISHSHSDHAGFVSQYQFVDLFMSNETRQECGISGSSVHVVEPNKQFCADEYTIIAFDVLHDVRCFGYLISHKESGNILFITDLCYTEYTFEELNNILIECNYRLDTLEANIAAGIVPEITRNRTIKSHMSFDTCKETLLANDLSAVNNIVLTHLSKSNSNAVEFQQGIYQATGKTVHVADRNMILNLDKYPF